MLAASAFVAGCASLPSLRLARQSAISESVVPITFEGPEGPWSSARANEASQRIVSATPNSLLDEYLGMSARLIREPLLTENRVDLLIDGPATHEAMFDAIRGSRRSIDLQSFIFEEIEQGGDRLTDLLAERAAAGVSIRVLVDGVGSWGADGVLSKLTAAGVRTCVFNPVAWSFLRPGRLNHRDHRKIVVVDGGEDAFAGGINFSRVYHSGSSFAARRSRKAIGDGWRDTHVRIRGPGAIRLGELFMDSWSKQGCAGLESLDGAFDRPRVVTEGAGGTVVQIIPSSPDSEQNLTYLSVLGAVAFARVSVSITMAYFVPDERLERALIRAVRRGVEVRIILPSFSDFSGVFHAGRSHYQALLDGGVRLFEQDTAFLHAKTVVVDDIWSTVGSTNWDWRSFMHNDEVSVVVIDEGFATRMRRMFDDDLEKSTEVTLARWKQRRLTHRVLERFWSGFERLL